MFGEDGDDSIFGGAGDDRLQGGAGNDTLLGGLGNDILLGQEDDDVVIGDAGDDELQGNEGNDSLSGGDGNDLIFGQAGNDFLTGGAGADELHGDEGDDTLFGDAGDDIITGDSGNDTIVGGTGNDTLAGGSGDDRYEFGYGDGNDLVIDDGGVADVIALSFGIFPADIKLNAVGDDLEVILLDNRVPTEDKLTVIGWANPSNTVESIAFSDGTVWDVPTIQSLLPDNQALANGVLSSGSAGDTTFSFPADIADGFDITLSDLGGTQDSLLFSNFLIPGIPPELGSFFLRPSLAGSTREGNDLVLDVVVVSDIATDPDRNGQVRISDFYTEFGHIETISFSGSALNEPNAPPVVTDTAPDQIIAVDVPYSFQLASDTFSDGSFDFLRVSAVLANGGPLPLWMSFDAETLTFSGTPTASDSALLDVVVTATDSGIQSASVDFVLNVGNVNIAPALANPFADQAAKADDSFSFQVPSDTFVDPNPGDALTVTATLSDGSPLPGWLSFDSLTGTFSGTPADTDVGTIDVSVLATDSGGLTASDAFTLTVKEANVPPNVPVSTRSLGHSAAHRPTRT